MGLRVASCAISMSLGTGTLRLRGVGLNCLWLMAFSSGHIRHLLGINSMNLLKTNNGFKARFISKIFKILVRIGRF
jgi:hypothetical protein